MREFMFARKALLIALLIPALAACASTGGSSTSSRPDSRAAAQTVPTESGLLAGGSAGGTIGRRLTRGDRDIMLAATQAALESGGSGTVKKWVNRDTGANGRITPQIPFTEGGKRCREFQQVISAGGETATGFGTACRGGDGRWRLLGEV